MMDIRGTDGVLRTPEEHYDTQGAVEQDPYGAHLAIQIQAAEIADLRAQLAAAEADKLAAMEQVREAAIKEAEDRTPSRPLASRATANSIAEAIRALNLADAQAALDAAITKAVNAKLEEVAAKAVEWSMKNPDENMILAVFADEILAMKEPE